jgi:hypothetical protein
VVLIREYGKNLASTPFEIHIAESHLAEIADNFVSVSRVDPFCKEQK